MIVQWFVAIVAAIWHGICALIPPLPVPSWVTDSSGWFASLFTVAGSMGAWVPLNLGTTVGAVVLSCIAIGFAIKAARIVLSLATAGGGSAG